MANCGNIECDLSDDERMLRTLLNCQNLTAIQRYQTQIPCQQPGYRERGNETLYWWKLNQEFRTEVKSVWDRF